MTKPPKRLLDILLAEIQPNEAVLDVGSGLKHLYKNGAFYGKIKNYQTLDINAQYKPDILGDIMNLPLEAEQFEVVICKAVLEHVPEPQKAINEIYRILKPGGRVYFYVPFLYPYHAQPKDNYGDYFRYTKDGLNYLCQNFSSIKIQPVDGLARTITLLIPFKFLRKILGPLAIFLDHLKPAKNQTSGFEVIATKTK